MRVRVTTQGAKDLVRAIAYLESQSPQAADDFRQRFSQVIDGLTRFDTSRATLDPRYRIMNLQPFPYLIFLRRQQDQIEIVAVRHGARSPGSMPARPR